MIKLFEKVIKEKLAELLAERDFPMSYLKFSTATSGSGLNDKVIFLVFKNQESSPFLCLKTVRNYEARQSISRNFDNLRKLNKLTRGSSHTQLFAEALYLHDDGENVFCAETACRGERIKLDRDKLEVVVMKYIGFQEHLVKQGNGSMGDMKQLVRETIIKSNLDELVQQKLLEYVTRFFPSGVKLPRVIQHGDLTLDNLLWSKMGVHIIDYDYVGNSDVPGFDLFSLFRRFDQINSLELCEKYFPVYFEKIGGEFLDHNYRELLFLYRLIERTQGDSYSSKDVSFEQIISDFDQLYPTALFS